MNKVLASKRTVFFTMEKLQYFILLCFGFLSVYNFLRDMEVDNRVGELETRQQGNENIYFRRLRFGELCLIRKSITRFFHLIRIREECKV